MFMIRSANDARYYQWCPSSWFEEAQNFLNGVVATESGEMELGESKEEVMKRFKIKDKDMIPGGNFSPEWIAECKVKCVHVQIQNQREAVEQERKAKNHAKAEEKVRFKHEQRTPGEALAASRHEDLAAAAKKRAFESRRGGATAKGASKGYTQWSTFIHSAFTDAEKVALETEAAWSKEKASISLARQQRAREEQESAKTCDDYIADLKRESEEAIDAIPKGSPVDQREGTRKQPREVDKDYFHRSVEAGRFGGLPCDTSEYHKHRAESHHNMRVDISQTKRDEKTRNMRMKPAVVED